MFPVVNSDAIFNDTYFFNIIEISSSKEMRANRHSESNRGPLISTSHHAKVSNPRQILHKVPFLNVTSKIQSNPENSNLQGKSKKGSRYREFELLRVRVIEGKISKKMT